MKNEIARGNDAMKSLAGAHRRPRTCSVKEGPAGALKHPGEGRIMKLTHLFRKALFRSRMDGFKDMLREMVYLNRTMIVIEKDIRPIRPVQNNELRFVVMDRQALKEKSVKCEPLVRYHCSQGAHCVMAYLGLRLIGYQFYTRDNSFPDLVKIGLSMGPAQAYLFDLFVFPEHRGTEITKKIVDWTFQHLLRQGITKIYGFYFADNVRSLWWHKAILKCKEVKRIKACRLFFLEWTDRKNRSGSRLQEQG